MVLLLFNLSYLTFFGSNQMNNPLSLTQKKVPFKGLATHWCEQAADNSQPDYIQTIMWDFNNSIITALPAFPADF